MLINDARYSPKTQQLVVCFLVGAAAATESFELPDLPFRIRMASPVGASVMFGAGHSLLFLSSDIVGESLLADDDQWSIVPLVTHPDLEVDELMQSVVTGFGTPYLKPIQLRKATKRKVHQTDEDLVLELGDPRGLSGALDPPSPPECAGGSGDMPVDAVEADFLSESDGDHDIFDQRNSDIDEIIDDRADEVSADEGGSEGDESEDDGRVGDLGDSADERPDTDHHPLYDFRCGG